MLRFWLPMGLLLLLSAGCALTALPPQAARYDLGLPAPQKTGENEVRRAAAAVEVQAPSWLRGQAMQYRLAYREENRRHAYAESRWAADPGEMIALALERALAGGPACRLRLSLDEFIQVFESPESSHTLLLIRAETRGESGNAVRRDFLIREEAPSPDAAGGVAAQRAALSRLTTEVTEWLAAAEVCL